MISQRTTAALQAVKARGVRLGNPNGAAALLAGCRAAAERSVAVRQARAAQHAAGVEPLLEALSVQGLSPAGIAAALNARGVPSATGGNWYAEQVRRKFRTIGLARAA